MKVNRDDLYPILYECCRLVKGTTRSTICDLQRGSYRLIPNDLYEMLVVMRGKTMRELKRHYNGQYDDIIDRNLALLEHEEIVIMTDDPELFPPMSMEWESPSDITNCIIDVDPDRLHDFDNLWMQLADLGCERVELRSYEPLTIQMIDVILEPIKSKRVISIEIICPDLELMEDESWISLVHRYPRIAAIILHSAGRNTQVYRSPTDMGHVIKTTQRITSESHCGLIGPRYFTPNVRFFTESIAYNSCLNRKISIDTIGRIKNCPSMHESYGNLEDASLRQAMSMPGFKKYWTLCKDEIEGCRDCEFRYICTDCRAYVEESDGRSDGLTRNTSKPLKCGYNPYVGQWTNWSDNPLKSARLEYYGLEKECSLT